LDSLDHLTNNYHFIYLKDITYEQLSKQENGRPMKATSNNMICSKKVQITSLIVTDEYPVEVYPKT
jgi:hypothetical protein